MQSNTIRAVLVFALLNAGCRSHQEVVFDPADSYLPFALEVEYPDVHESGQAILADTSKPPSVRDPEEMEKWPLTLEEAVQLALTNSQVIRDLGGRALSSPGAVPTIYDPALREADPRQGVEAALGAFDAQFNSHLFLEQVDRVFNNRFLGQGSFGLLSQLADFHMGITKTAATGAEFTFENQTAYDRNASINQFSAQSILFPSVYDTLFRAGVRQPLLQGAGVEFNRIAGPQATPGNYNGVLLARLDTDVSLADFEASVRDLLRDVERTYWELYFAYRDFDAKVIGRRLALESWDLEKRRADAGIRTIDQEAFARDQFYVAQIAVENALSGSVNGASGIYSVELQLRNLLGLPTSDGRVIVPADSPTNVDVRFDWHDSLAYAFTRRVELRRQQWTIKRRELELIASRNFERMRLDFVGEYRWRGFGDLLFGGRTRLAGSAFDTLFNGDLQDWRLGIEATTPVGNRVGHTAVRHAQLQLVREQAVYEEMERQISHELRAAHTELDRAYTVTRSNYNRRLATFVRLQAERQRNEKGRTDLDLVLDAQRQAVDAESNYYRSLVDYNLALLNLQYSRGTLLDHYHVYLAEGPWSQDAHCSAARMASRFRARPMNYCLSQPPPVSAGAYPQRFDSDSSLPSTDDAPPVEEPIPLPDAELGH